MAHTVTTDRPGLAGLTPDDVVDGRGEHGLDTPSDSELVDLAAAVIAEPRSAPADSFVLHAPLELMARAGLLRHLEPAERDRARHRIARLAAEFAATGPAHEPGPTPTRDDPRRWLAAAIDAGDLEAVDAAAIALCGRSTPDELVAAMADVVVPRLSAAAHGSIFLYQLPRLLPRSTPGALMARGLVRELARQPGWRLEWIDHRAGDVATTGDLVERLLAPRAAGDAGSNFIYPTMSLVDRTGLAAELLDSPTRSLSIGEARRDLLRVAAWSMLQDDAAHAPYGWTHCLTMPQATLGIATSCADPGRAVAVAATYVLGFRSTLGSVALDPERTPQRPDALVGPDDLLGAGPAGAAALVWHATDARYPALVRRIATYAALHPDAHLAKYTLACLDATRDDPGAGRLFMAAAAYLAAWWSAADGSPAE